jgi:simple sugar transport system permease protein
MQPEAWSSGLAVAARLKPPLLTAAAFVAAASVFFLLIGLAPLRTLADMVMFAAGDSYSLSETLVKTAPILLCALATLLPARLGLVSVGADGQLYLGALVGAGVVLAIPDYPAALLLPAMLVGGMIGGGLWGLVAGVLRGR